jgi:hypothetical protein
MKTAPPSGAPPAHSSPSTNPQFAAPGGGEVAQVPSVLPAATLHVPVQQSEPVEQASPGCTQKDEGWQVPLEQSPEQHAAFDAHALPIVLQVALSAAHLPPLQVWLQHWPLVAHATPSDRHCG